MRVFHDSSLKSQLSRDSLHSRRNQGAWLLRGGSCFLMLFSQFPCMTLRVFQPLHPLGSLKCLLLNYLEHTLVLLTLSLQIEEGFSTIYKIVSVNFPYSATL
uniref:Uncharacterized protein n=1 Tax=Macaca nemestrina TaxID=9545 RepID=A0A2K6CUF2_MACNE